MKVAYDVKVPHKQYGTGKYAKPFWEFYESDHQTVKIEFDTKQEAMKAYKAIYEIRVRNNLDDVRMARIGNVVYLQKGRDEDGN